MTNLEGMMCFKNLFVNNYGGNAMSVYQLLKISSYAVLLVCSSQSIYAQSPDKVLFELIDASPK